MWEWWSSIFVLFCWQTGKSPWKLKRLHCMWSDEERECFKHLVKPAPWKIAADDPIVEIAHLLKKQRLVACQISASSSPSLPILTFHLQRYILSWKRATEKSDILIHRKSFFSSVWFSSIKRSFLCVGPDTESWTSRLCNEATKLMVSGF